jgi:tetratricopeptide (TPR) repeat protein
MKGGTISAQLFKREKNTVWLRRMATDGTPGPQVGYDASDILAVDMPRPPFFTNVDAILSATNRVPAPLYAHAHGALDKFILQSRPFRDLPGVQSDEAIFLKARLFDRQGQLSDALSLYDSLRMKDPPSLFATNAMIRSGIVHARLTNSLEAVECLSGVLLPEDDEQLLSDLLFALGDAYVQLGNWDHALLSYLPLVVCYPYYGQNEVRAMAKTLPCYAALQEWEPLYRTIQDIRSLYPDSPAAAYAAQFVKKYKDGLATAGGFVESGERLVDDAVPDAVAGTTAAKDAPDYTQIPTSAPPAEEEDEIEYPPDL